MKNLSVLSFLNTNDIALIYSKRSENGRIDMIFHTAKISQFEYEKYLREIKKIGAYLHITELFYNVHNAIVELNELYISSETKNIRYEVFSDKIFDVLNKFYLYIENNKKRISDMFNKKTQSYFSELLCNMYDNPNNIYFLVYLIRTHIIHKENPIRSFSTSFNKKIKVTVNLNLLIRNENNQNRISRLKSINHEIDVVELILEISKLLFDTQKKLINYCFKSSNIDLYLKLFKNWDRNYDELDIIKIIESKDETLEKRVKLETIPFRFKAFDQLIRTFNINLKF